MIKYNDIAVLREHILKFVDSRNLVINISNPQEISQRNKTTNMCTSV